VSEGVTFVEWIKTRGSDMQVRIEEGFEGDSIGAVCDLIDCFPDEGDDYVEALESLQRTGEYRGGGGAAPVFRLVRVD